MPILTLKTRFHTRVTWLLRNLQKNVEKISPILIRKWTFFFCIFWSILSTFKYHGQDLAIDIKISWNYRLLTNLFVTTTIEICNFFCKQFITQTIQYTMSQNVRAKGTFDGNFFIIFVVGFRPFSLYTLFLCLLRCYHVNYLLAGKVGLVTQLQI